MVSVNLPITLSRVLIPTVVVSVKGSTRHHDSALKKEFSLEFVEALSSGAECFVSNWGLHTK